MVIIHCHSNHLVAMFIIQVNLQTCIYSDRFIYESLKCKKKKNNNNKNENIDSQLELLISIQSKCFCIV